MSVFWLIVLQGLATIAHEISLALTEERDDTKRDDRENRRRYFRNMRDKARQKQRLGTR